jgi:hypothetical protein
LNLAIQASPYAVAQRQLIGSMFGEAAKRQGPHDNAPVHAGTVAAVSPGRVASPLPSPNLARPAVAQRNGGDGAVVRRSDHEATLDLIADEVIAAEADPARARLLSYLRKGFGVGGTSVLRSSEVKTFRDRMKESAREQAAADIDQQLAADTDHGAATQGYLAIAARGEAYGRSKKSVDAELGAEAAAWLAGRWDDNAVRAGARAGVKDAAWAVLHVKPGSKWQVKSAKKAARAAAHETIGREAEAAMADARAWKNIIVKPADATEAVTSAAEQQRLEAQVGSRTAADRVGERSLETAIRANTTDEGLGILGRFLDQMIPQPGDSVSLSVELKIPIPDSPAYVTLKLEGKAGRGTTGFTTSGVTKLGDPRRLEIMARFSVGVGAEAFGLKGDFSVGFFVRAGANDGTAATMKSLSYGAYRSASALSGAFGNWWAGAGKGSDLSAVERAESWAAMIEEQVYGADSSAFTDIGGSAGLSGKANAGFATLGGTAGGELFRRYDQAGLAASLGPGRFAQPLGPGGKADSEQRRRAAAGRTVGSIGFAVTAEAKILGQKVSFAGSFSAEKSAGDDNTFGRNWGIEFSAALGFSPGTMSEVDKIAAGFVSGGLSVVQTIAQMIQKQKVGAFAVDLTSEYLRLANAGFQNQITEGLGKLWTVEGSKLDNVVGDSKTAIADAAGLVTSSTLLAAITFGRTGGNWVLRFEVRDSKSMSINIGGGTNVGVAIQADRSKRLFALGVESDSAGDKRLAFEGLGLRPNRRT